MFLGRVVRLDLINEQDIFPEQRVQYSCDLKDILDGKTVRFTKLNENFARCWWSSQLFLSGVDSIEELIDVEPGQP